MSPERFHRIGNAWGAAQIARRNIPANIITETQSSR
jgi:hypothetical protein